MKVQKKILIIILSVVILISISSILISRNIATKIIKQQTADNLIYITQSRAEHIKTLLDLEKEATKQLSESIVIRELLSSTKEEEDYSLKFDKVMLRLKNTAQVAEYYNSIFVLDTKGTIIASSYEEDIGEDKSNDTYFLGGKEGVFIKDAYISSYKQEKTLTFSDPILDEDNKLLGVIVFRVSPEPLFKITTDRTGLGETGEVYLVNKNGYMITPSRFIDDVILKQKITSRHLEHFEPSDTPLKEGLDIVKGYRGIEVLSVDIHLPEMNWCLIAQIDTEEAFAPVTQLTNTLVLLFAIILLVVIFISNFISRNITKSFRRLHEGTGEITKGNLDYKVGTTSTDEVGQLSRAFDQMTVHLKKSREELEEYSRNLEKKVEERTRDLWIDIRKRKEIEEVLMESENRFRELFSNMSSGVTIYEAKDNGKDFIIKDFNLAGERIDKVKKEDIVGKNILQVFPGVKAFGLFKVFQEVFQTGEPQHHPISLYQDQRISGWRENYVYKLPSGEIVSIFTDITERKQAEDALKQAHDQLENKVAQRTEELQKANLKLQELDRLKTIFIASMSHELRTPLTLIIGFTDIILQEISGEINQEQRRQFTLVKKNANHLLSLISDVLDINKIEAGKAEMIIEEFDLSALSQEIKDNFRIAADKKGLELSFEIPPTLLIESDMRRTKQILVNLLSNALKFTDRGEIKIKVIPRDETVEVSVRDSGSGIKKEDMHKLFNAFSQIPNQGRIEEGTGLGLYLSKKNAHLLGGDILVESEPGKGSVFTLSLPLKYKEAKV